MWKSKDTFGKNLGCGCNMTFSLKKIVRAGYDIRDPISPILEAEVMAVKKAAFIDKCTREQVAIGSKGGSIRDLCINIRS